MLILCSIVHVDPGAKQKGPGTSHPPLSALPAESSRYVSILLHLRCSFFADLTRNSPLLKVSSTPLYPVASAMLILCRFMSVDPSQPKKTRPSRKLGKVTPKPPSDQPGSSSNQPGPPLSDTRRKKNRPGQPQTSGPAVVPIGPLSDTRHQPPPGSPPPPQVPHRSSNRPWEWGPTPT